jgi:2,3-bisphosphoglycerate-dependent phosphoglycerate mutase
MKILISFLFAAALFSVAGGQAYGQYNYKNLTIILIRHAEKDPQDEEFGNSYDPRLSEKGRERAERLADILERYRPDAIFSSQFNRTLSTVSPYARRRRMQVQFYDHRKLDEMAQIATRGNFKTIVIAGHNTTTPALANILIGEEKYKTLDESEYDKIFILRIRKNKNGPHRIEDEVITY